MNGSEEMKKLNLFASTGSNKQIWLVAFPIFPPFFHHTSNQKREREMNTLFFHKVIVFSLQMLSFPFPSSAVCWMEGEATYFDFHSTLLLCLSATTTAIVKIKVSI